MTNKVFQFPEHGKKPYYNFGQIKRKSDQKYCTWDITEEMFQQAVIERRWNVLLAFFNWLEKPGKKVWATYILNYLPDLVKDHKNKGRKRKIESKLKGGFFDRIIDLGDKSTLESVFNDLIDNFELTGKNKINLAKKLGKSKAFEIFSKEKEDHVKKRLLKYLPTAAVAISDKNIDLREKAKKELGLIKKLTNHQAQIRNAFREALQERFPKGKLKKGTCNFIFGDAYPELESFNLNWETEWNRSVYDDNHLSFSVELLGKHTPHRTLSSWWSSTLKCEVSFTAVMFKEHFWVETTKGAYYSSPELILTIKKENYKLLIQWVKENLCDWIDTWRSSSFTMKRICPSCLEPRGYGSFVCDNRKVDETPYLYWREKDPTYYEQQLEIAKRDVAPCGDTTPLAECPVTFDQPFLHPRYESKALSFWKKIKKILFFWKKEKKKIIQKESDIVKLKKCPNCHVSTMGKVVKSDPLLVNTFLVQCIKCKNIFYGKYAQNQIQKIS